MSSTSAADTRSDVSSETVAPVAPSGSAEPSGSVAWSGAGEDDRTARARIRDAALRLFGDDGYDGTTIRAIADAADVSPALVVHHFGSKQGLRDTVEGHLLEMVRDGKFAAMTGSLVPSEQEYADLAAEYVPAMAYLARSLTEGGELGHELYARLHADAVDYLAAGVEAGMLAPSDDPEARAAVLLNVGLGHLLLLGHLQRVLGLDDDLAASLRSAPILLDLYTDGLFTDDRFRSAWRTPSDPDDTGATSEGASGAASGTDATPGPGPATRQARP